MRQDKAPDNIIGWKKATRKEHQKWGLIKVSSVLGEGRQLSNHQNKWQNTFKGWTPPGRPTKDPDAMDVDNIQLNPLTDEEWKKLSAEGLSLSLALK
jgi:hypothetical protein